MSIMNHAHCDTGGSKKRVGPWEGGGFVTPKEGCRGSIQVRMLY